MDNKDKITQKEYDLMHRLCENFFQVAKPEEPRNIILLLTTTVILSNIIKAIQRDEKDFRKKEKIIETLDIIKTDVLSNLESTISTKFI